MTASVKQPAVFEKRVLSAKQRQQPKFSLGERGEHQALAFLQSHGYQLLARNVRVGRAELDLVMFDTVHQEVVFVEVKTRSSKMWGDPSQAIGHKKRRAMRQAATQYLRQSGMTQDYRFDIVAVLPGTIRHYQDTTW